MRTIYPEVNGFILKFPEGDLNQQVPEVGQKAQWLKHCNYE